MPTPNRLAAEKSPYLLQHGHNPVDWFPWGPEAFARAEAEDRPVFLSIGYATCHWCHVMERESFEDEMVAELLRRDFISIKVDREERPDIDGIYMTVCQMMTGHGGWPLTVVMTPDKQPFFAGTYFPRVSVPGRIGMLDLLPRLATVWKERRDDAETAARSAMEAVRELESRNLRSPVGDGGAEKQSRSLETLRRGFDQLHARFDRRWGGFGTAPKFPTPHQLLFLLRWATRSGDSRATNMVEHTLTQMRRGGIFDHVGYGFHRYSTDQRWLVPHFEKMLYDQALLAMCYIELWQLTGNEEYQAVAREIFEYVLRDLTHPQGAFYSAEDADSEGREGAFYVWTSAEFQSVVKEKAGYDVADLAGRAFCIEADGNFADEATGAVSGENILHETESRATLSQETGWSEDELTKNLEAARLALFDHRKGRPRPLLDDKVLTDWNGLMIAVLAQAGCVFNDPTLTSAAESAARFIMERLWDDSGGVLLHRYRDGDAAIAAGAVDHAFLAWGFIELYQATWNPIWLERAGRLLSVLQEEFWDPDGEGVFTSAAGVTDVPIRQKETYDGALPSANSATWYVMLRYAHLTGDEEMAERAARLGEAFGTAVMNSPAAHTMALVAMDLALGPRQQVVVAGDPAAPDTATLLEEVRGFAPRRTLLVKVPGQEQALEAVAPWTRSYGQVGGRSAAWVCTDWACQAPVTDADALRTLLR